MSIVLFTAPAAPSSITVTQTDVGLRISWTEPSSTLGEIRDWLIGYTVNGERYNTTEPASQRSWTLPNTQPYTVYSDISVRVTYKGIRPIHGLFLYSSLHLAPFTYVPSEIHHRSIYQLPSTICVIKV